MLGVVQGQRLRRMGEERGVGGGVEMKESRWHGLASRSWADLLSPDDSQSAEQKPTVD